MTVLIAQADAERINILFGTCTWSDEADTTHKGVVVTGGRRTPVAFNLDLLQEHRSYIIDLFKKVGANFPVEGGWTCSKALHYLQNHPRVARRTGMTQLMQLVTALMPLPATA